MATEKQNFLLNIRGSDPLEGASPFYANFLSVSRIGTDVQLEFIFVDINQLATLTEHLKASGTNGVQEIVGKTVSKVVMPGASFVQIKEHLNTIFEALSAELQIGDVDHAATHESSSVR